MAFVLLLISNTILIVLLFCFFLLFLFVLPAAGGIPLHLTTPLKLIDCTSEIICGFQTKTVYVYFENDTSLSYPSQILHQLNGCGISYISLRNKYKVGPLEVINDDGVLMFLTIVLRDASQPIEPTSIIRKRSAAKHLSHVLLVIQDARAINQKWLQNIFRKFWRMWVLKVVIIFWRHDELQIYRYNPFMHQFLLIKIDTNVGGGVARLPGLPELFPTGLPDMHGQPIRVCMYVDEMRAIFNAPQRASGGSDLRLMMHLAERLNATPIVHLVNSRANQSDDICFSEVSSELDDMALNIRFLSAPTFQGQVESTTVLGRDDLCVLVPKADTASTFWNLLRPFKLFVWLAMLLSLALSYALCSLVLRYTATRQLLLQLFASTLSLPWTWLPRKFALRLFLLAWLVYGLLISSAYRGNLTSNLVFRTYLPDVDSIQDLAQSPYNILFFARHRKHLTRFLNTSNHYENLVLRKLVVMPDDVLSLHIQVNNLSYAYVQKQHLAMFQATARRHSHRGRPLYHVMSTCLVPFHAVYIVPYGSPYLGYLNKVIRSANEFGFGIYWNRMAAVSFITSGKSLVQGHKKDDDDPVVLKLDHLRAAFCVWITGLLVAFVVFLWEINKQQYLIAYFSQFGRSENQQRTTASREML